MDPAVLSQSRPVSKKLNFHAFTSVCLSPAKHNYNAGKSLCRSGGIGSRALSYFFSYGPITKTFSTWIQPNVWALSKHTGSYSSAALNFNLSYHLGSCNIKPGACCRLYSTDSTSHNSEIILPLAALSALPPGKLRLLSESLNAINWTQVLVQQIACLCPVGALLETHVPSWYPSDPSISIVAFLVAEHIQGHQRVGGRLCFCSWGKASHCPPTGLAMLKKLSHTTT